MLQEADAKNTALNAPLASEPAVITPTDISAGAPAEPEIVEVPLDDKPETEAPAEGLVGWFWWAGQKTLDGIDFLGEFFADILGLTDSKYAYYIAEAERMKLAEAKKRQEELNAVGEGMSAMEGGDEPTTEYQAADSDMEGVQH
eukprot:GFYU01005961.1.p1 GENE.GFYU01005961.1~~GFYU01005961.1.p1  ORF type:complete len:144 (+),score=51.47 GFYU01005961.1:161-592(+)